MCLLLYSLAEFQPEVRMHKAATTQAVLINPELTGDRPQTTGMIGPCPARGLGAVGNELHQGAISE